MLPLWPLTSVLLLSAAWPAAQAQEFRLLNRIPTPFGDNP